MMKKRITFALSEEVIKLLKEHSANTMIPQSRIVEQAILEYIKKESQ